MFPKNLIRTRLRELGTPDFSDSNNPYGLLAALPLPVYVTTNYDDFMVRALKAVGKDPQREVCRWNRDVRRAPSVFDDQKYEPSVERPLVFHLHGHTELLRSIVLTEDDYIDFLMNVRDAIPPRVQGAFSGASVLFLGYRLADVNFRLLFRNLVLYLERVNQYGHVSVQLLPGDIPQERRRPALEYLKNYYDRLNVHVYWGSCQKFTADLRRHWTGQASETDI
jgi:hypothetical protein